MKVLVKRASELSDGYIKKVKTIADLLKMMEDEGDPLIINNATEYDIKKMGPHDFKILIYDDYIE